MSFFNLTTEYSLWLAIPCLLLGITYAMLLYFRGQKYDFKKSTLRTLFVLRTLAVFLIAFLLLSPLVMTRSRTTEKPLIILAQDNSQSPVFCKDSANIRTRYSDELRQLSSSLSDDYDVKTFTFGEKVTEGTAYTYDEKQTDFSLLFDEIQARYANRNIGAVILASDGLYNKGSNPLYLTGTMKYPFYTIALGDTNIQKDLIISRVNYNRISYLGNIFPLETVLKADKCAGQKVTLTITKGRETLFAKTIDINSARYLETLQFQLEAKEVGMQHYRVSVSTLEGEISLINNTQDVFVEVLDGREKILLLAGAPHPDVAALKQSIETSKIYQVDEFVADKFNKSIKEYNLAIVHQIPLKGKNYQALLNSLTENKIPVLYILGESSDMAAFNNLKTGLGIRQAAGKYDEAAPTVANDFALFTVSEELKKVSADFPALSVPFGEYLKSSSANVLMYQKIGSVQTQKPLVMFNTASEPKTGIVAGEGIWRWRMQNYLQTGNQTVFNELVHKIIQYLSVKVDKDRFRVNVKNKFYENEAVEFDAEVYNNSYELVNDPEVTLTITNSANKTFPFTFSRTAHAYHINAGIFPLGEYRFTAQAKAGSTRLQKTGVFTVVPVNIESLNLIADHQLMFSLAQKSNGKMLYPGQLSQIPGLLKGRDDVKSVTYTKKRFSDVVNLFWVFLIILALLSTEWFIRKRFGAY
ncbi:MAG TPA: hypothetical protein PLE11_03085 [Bacteroidales bacterium]|nr:hypothetical protein [Bacteroidales bacterium]